MHQTFIIAGVVCIIAAIVGGGLKAFGVEMPLLNSTPRQIILGIAGIVFLFFGMGWNKGSDDRTPIEPEKEKDSIPTSVPLVQEMRITASPDSQLIHINNETKINVFIFKADNTPVEGVKIRIKAPAGSFTDNGTKTEVGTTDSRGRFTTKWKAPGYYSPHRYRFDVSALKEGFTDAHFNFSIGMSRF